MLLCAYYYYSFEFRRKGGTTEGATVNFLMANRTNRTTSPSGKVLRDERFNYQRMPSSCYHCSWCFDRINLTRSKMASFSHTELNRVQFQAQEHILARYRTGKDLFDRASEVYVRVENNDEIPELVKAQPERFAYMTNRTTLVDVGFRDVT
jgi:beta-1,4-mannosyl-glycoprotein beta-1,4-N-acetylglucosaminyltransferase